MNAVEIEAAVSDLAAIQFDAVEFPFQFLAAFDKKDTTLKRLRKGDSNRSDVPGGILLQSNIHLAVCSAGETRHTLELLKASPKTASAKAKFVLATDGVVLEAEDLVSGEAIAPDYPRFAEHIGFFLPLAGISTVREIKDNPIDVRATGRLNKLYVELLRQNPEWGTDARRHDMNHFMARLIFCFFAEDTDIFYSRSLFTSTIEQFSESDGSNTHHVIEACFAAMNVKQEKRSPDNTPGYAVSFPYVNGGLFAGSTEVPQFTRIARSYLLQAGSLDWQYINPDIFGSMIQAVADDEERGALGMHYTSVPNILKVLNPLFLDDLRSALEAAGDNPRTLLNLRRRLSRIRVFDPACGSGNFLVIAYKEMRKIEAEINVRRGEHLRVSEISKKNFRGIELRDFAAEIARLALVIAEYQCDVLHRGPLAAKAEFLPLDEMNWITWGNALRLDWLKVCPPEGIGVKLVNDDLFQTPLEQPEIDFENEGGEIFICGNPPYYGSRRQEDEQKEDLKYLCSSFIQKWKSLDYVAGWLLLAKRFMLAADAECAFVTTSSLCEGLQVGVLWPHILRDEVELKFAYTPFSWSNLAASNAGVTVVIASLTKQSKRRQKQLFAEDGQVWNVGEITPYLTPGKTTFVDSLPAPISELPRMVMGSMPRDGGNLILGMREAAELVSKYPTARKLIRRYLGSEDLIKGLQRSCLWVEESDREAAEAIPEVASRFIKVSRMRAASSLDSTRDFADSPYRFVYLAGRSTYCTIAVSRVSSIRREYLPVDLLGPNCVPNDQLCAVYDGPVWALSLVASRLHTRWIAAVCGKLKTDYRYSNTLGWNTFPVPKLTEQNKVDLTCCAENILLARESHFPATIADLYDPETMPTNLRAAHDANDETLERIYIGRRFRNDTERLETLFTMYSRLQGTGVQGIKKPNARKVKAGVEQ